jgi:hypothetical protein
MATSSIISKIKPLEPLAPLDEMNQPGCVAQIEDEYTRRAHIALARIADEKKQEYEFYKRTLEGLERALELSGLLTERGTKRAQIEGAAPKDDIHANYYILSEYALNVFRTQVAPYGISVMTNGRGGVRCNHDDSCGCRPSRMVDVTFIRV